MMDKSEFESLMIASELFRIVNPEHAEFHKGYQRGLRRLYHGDNFGTNDEHDLWYNLPDDGPDEIRVQRGRGYRAGFAGHALTEENNDQPRI